MRLFATRCFVMLACWVLVACAKDGRDQFVGVWRSATTDAEAQTTIKRTADDYFINEGQQDLLGKYDVATKSILIDNGTQKIPVLYLPEADEIMVSAGDRSAKFKRVEWARYYW